MSANYMVGNKVVSQIDTVLLKCIKGKGIDIAGELSVGTYKEDEIEWFTNHHLYKVWGAVIKVGDYVMDIEDRRVFKVDRIKARKILGLTPIDMIKGHSMEDSYRLSTHKEVYKKIIASTRKDIEVDRIMVLEVVDYTKAYNREIGEIRNLSQHYDRLGILAKDVLK